MCQFVCRRRSCRGQAYGMFDTWSSNMTSEHVAQWIPCVKCVTSFKYIVLPYLCLVLFPPFTTFTQSGVKNQFFYTSRYPRRGVRKASVPELQSLGGLVELSILRRYGLCKNRNFSIEANFGLGDTVIAEFCSKHKKVGMVNIRGQPCGVHLCTMHPSYGKEGSVKREVCSKHKTNDIVYIRIDTCAYQGCLKRPTYGMDGSTKAELC